MAGEYSLDALSLEPETESSCWAVYPSRPQAQPQPKGRRPQAQPQPFKSIRNRRRIRKASRPIYSYTWLCIYIYIYVYACIHTYTL